MLALDAVRSLRSSSHDGGNIIKHMLRDKRNGLILNNIGAVRPPRNGLSAASFVAGLNSSSQTLFLVQSCGLFFIRMLIEIRLISHRTRHKDAIHLPRERSGRRTRGRTIGGFKEGR